MIFKYIFILFGVCYCKNPLFVVYYNYVWVRFAPTVEISKNCCYSF